jgi:hypothetical protein
VNEQDWEPPGGWGVVNEKSPAVFRYAARLRQEMEELRAQNECDACGGTGKPISGLDCMCGGTGKMSDAARYLREKVVHLESENTRLREVEKAAWIAEPWVAQAARRWPRTNAKRAHVNLLAALSSARTAINNTGGGE